jgi:hypothetical protein
LLADATKAWVEARASLAESGFANSPPFRDPADDSRSAASESFAGSGQLRSLREQGRLFQALLRLSAALDESGDTHASPDAFDLLAAAQALIATAQTKGSITLPDLPS